jgi:hypothetical protein
MKHEEGEGMAGVQRNAVEILEGALLGQALAKEAKKLYSMGCAWEEEAICMPASTNHR